MGMGKSSELCLEQLWLFMGAIAVIPGVNMFHGCSMTITDIIVDISLVFSLVMT